MLGSLLQAIPYLLQTAPGIKAGYKGVDLKAQKKALGQMNQLAAQQSKLAAAQTDMNNPLFQSIYGQERQAGQADLADTIAELSRQNRRLTSMGRNPLLDRERGGESIFRNLIQGQQDAGNTARANTFAQLGRGQDALTGAQSAYGAIYKGQSDVADKRFKNSTYNQIASHQLGSVLQNLFGLPQTQQSWNGNFTYGGMPEEVTWNQPIKPVYNNRGGLA